MIEDVEVFRPQLELPALGKVNVLGELHVPVEGARQTQRVLADVSKCAEDYGVVRAAHFSGLKGRRVQPAHTSGGYTRARIVAVRADAWLTGIAGCAVPGAIGSAVVADTGAGDFRALQNGDRAAGGCGHDAAPLPVAEDVMHQAVLSRETWKLPHVGAAEYVSVIERRRSVVELVPVRIGQR